MIIKLIFLALAGIFMFPVYHMLQGVEFFWDFGEILILVFGLLIGWTLCRLSDSNYGLAKMLFMACLFIALVGYLGIIGWIIVVGIAMIW